MQRGNRQFKTADHKLRRRNVLIAGALGVGGISLPNLLRAEAAAGIRGSRKAIINVHLDGGPPQMDAIDPKPEAPVEIRGEFFPVQSSQAGVNVCETMPRLAQQIDDFVLIRSLVESAGRHDAFQCQSGFSTKDLQAQGGRPALGSIIDKLLASTSDSVPAFVDMMQGRPLVRDSARPGFLGAAHRPFRPDLSAMFKRELEPGMKNELARLGNGHTTSLTLNPDLTTGRLDQRMALATHFDRLRREVDHSGMMDAVDSFHQQAVEILTSGRLAAALDLSTEDPRTLARYKWQPLPNRASPTPAKGRTRF